MEFKQLNDKIDILNKLIANHQLGELFKAVNRTIDDNKVLLQLKDKVRKQFEIYNNLLKYSFTTIKDPERDVIYSKILVSLYQIIDEIKLVWIKENKYWALNTISHETNFEFGTNRGIIEKSILSSNYGRESDLFFKKIWISGKLNIDDASLIEKVLKSKKVTWINESLTVSALTISSLMSFDEQKLKFLFDFYFKGTAKVWQKAIVGIVLNVHFYSYRIKEYPELLKMVELIRKEKDFFYNLEYIILQMVRTKDTDKISKKLHDEIIPEVAKLKPKIEEKLKLDDILKEQFGEDKNPDWEMVFEDSPKLLSKLEEFSKMQIEGSDVFMSAFAMLKHFDFFKEPSHWFIPFYKENKDVIDAFKFEKEGFNSVLFIEGLEKSAFLCNSDKYSFIMNIKYMPEIQKNMMLEMFNAELESMNDLVKDDELINQSLLDKYIINQYIQDLYRFYKIFPNRTEFADIFSDKFELFESEIIFRWWFNMDLYKSIGSLYFRQEFFNETIRIFKILIVKGLNEQNVFEKIAYSYQKLGDYNNALANYKKSELFGTNMAWNYKKIALCNRVLNNNESALEYYLKCETLEPDNLYVQANIGHSYMRLKDYEGALKHYFKVEYFAPSNNKILRPIAWCSFALGKFDTSIKYYKKLILKNEASLTDYIGLGNAYWCKQEIDGAVDSFRKGISIFSSNQISFKKDFLEEKEFLFKYGILQFEIELMLDFLFLEKVVLDTI
jgi:tetratricopeptide (TPR) repeat protein